MEQYYLNERSEVAAFLPAETASLRFLEIGCGAGNFRKNLGVHQEYWGVEPQADAAALAQRALDRVLIGTFQDVYQQLPDRYFDCVICADVIEHMADEDRFLQTIKGKMTEGSSLVGSIPNVRYLSNLFRLVVLKDWKYTEAGILDRTHLRFFTERSLRRTFDRNRYRIDKFSGINRRGVSFRTPRSFALDSAAYVLSLLLGTDTRFVQFGFRIRPL